MIGGLPDTQITRHVTIKATRSIIDGVTFRNSDSSTGRLILIRSSSAVLFRNCVFNMTHPDGAKIWIAMEDGAKAVFNGCMWRGGDGTGGNLVNNAGPLETYRLLVACQGRLHQGQRLLIVQHQWLLYNGV